MWWRSGLIPPLGIYKSYWIDPFSLFWIEVILVQFAELKRWGLLLCVRIHGQYLLCIWHLPSPPCIFPAVAGMSCQITAPVVRQVAGLPPPWIPG